MKKCAICGKDMVFVFREGRRGLKAYVCYCGILEYLTAEEITKIKKLRRQFKWED